ncbi:MAG TPA: hypothetical protein VD931_19505 [Baekduia sp.]|nr:hypothetical protein [Baekduia sp.]
MPARRIPSSTASTLLASHVARCGGQLAADDARAWLAHRVPPRVVDAAILGATSCGALEQVTLHDGRLALRTVERDRRAA